MTQAFDSIKFELILAKLHYYEAGKNCLSWFSLYLRESMHINMIMANNETKVSRPREILTGVPQGYILSNLLFGIITSNFINIVQLGKLFINDDDIWLQLCFPSIDKEDAKLSPIKIQNLLIGTSSTLIISIRWPYISNMNPLPLLIMWVILV